MATKFQLVVTAGNLSGVTGHHEVTCYIEETRDDGTVVKGVPEVYGIEVHALTKRHGGDIGSGGTGSPRRCYGNINAGWWHTRKSCSGRAAGSSSKTKPLAEPLAESLVEPLAEPLAEPPKKINLDSPICIRIQTV